MPMKTIDTATIELPVTAEDLATIVCALSDGYFSNNEKYPATANHYWKLREKYMKKLYEIGHWEKNND